MKQSDGRKYLENFVFLLQKYRSNTQEFMDDNFDDHNLNRKFLVDLNPWIYGEKCPLPILIKLLERKNITTMDFYNFMTVLHQFTPEVEAVGRAFHGLPEFPKPNINLLRNGWDKE